MADHQAKYQPGPVFHEVFLGGMRVLGRSTSVFADGVGVQRPNMRAMSTGLINGPRSQAVRNKMIEAVGPEFFDHLWKVRMREEAAKLEAAQ